MSRKGSKCVSFSPDVLQKAAERSPEKGNTSRSKKCKAKACGRLRIRLCIPRLCRSSSFSMSPVRMLERFMRAVFRSSSKNVSSSSSSASSSCVRNHHPSAVKCYPGHFSPDSHYTEAIADCIEFIKKTSCTDQRVP